MKHFIFLLCTFCAFIAAAAEVRLTGVNSLGEAEKIGWKPRSTAELSVPSPGILRVQGKGVKRYCGIELKKIPQLDFSGSIKCKVRMNFGRQIYFVLSGSNGYFDIFLPVKPNTWQSVTVPLDIKKWRFRGKGAKPESFGNISFFAIMHPAMQKSSEFIEISDLVVPVINDVKTPQQFLLPANAAMLQSSIAEYSFSPDNGSLLAVKDKRTGKFAVQGVENHYFLQSRAGDAEAFERFDKVIKKSSGKNQLKFICTNPRLSGITIEKFYSIENDRLRRKTVFRNQNKQHTAFITPRTRVHFSNDFYHDGFYLGSGYIGPLMETPKITSPQQERSFLQTTKGMLLYHEGTRGSFSQYRTHLNGKFVFPWWQSAIATYQEKANALFYQPDGWEMSLGTIDVLPQKSFSIEDTFVFFSGNWYMFLTEIYPKDPVVSKVLHSFKPGPAWLEDAKVQLSVSGVKDMQKLALLLDEGEIIAMLGNVRTAAWGDYHFDTPKPGLYGGELSAEDIKAVVKKVRAISPHFRIGIYNWVNSALGDSDVVKKHPEFFMQKNRDLQEKNLFPGDYKINYPTMINRPEAAAFMLDNFRSLLDTFNFDYIYLDETKTVSLIDWQHNDLMRDDHWADFWMSMHKLGQEKKVLMFGNGRGNPYHELNYIEARQQLAPSFWRKFCGMAMAVATFVNNRPGARVDLLYWNPGMDYITRVLANGFIPTINFLRYQQIPYISANYELGKSTIYDLKYTPDWKYDPKTELESYAVKRKLGNEVVLSLINRSRQNSVDISVNTGDLPSQLTVWAYRVNKYADEPAKYGFGEKERRSNYRTTGWRENVITRPELLFMGKNPGKLALKLDNFAQDEFIQIVFSSGNAGSYSVDDMPCNYFLNTHRKLNVKQVGSSVEVVSNAAKAEVIIFQTPGVYSVNGKKVLAQPVRFGNKLYSVLPAARGKSVIRKLSDAQCASGEFTAAYKNGRLEYSGKGYVCIYDKNNILLYCGNTPRLPEYHDKGVITVASLDNKYQKRIKIACGKPSPAMLVKSPQVVPARSNSRKFATPLQRDGAAILEAVEYTSHWGSFSGIQDGLAPYTAQANADDLSVTVGTTQRIYDFLGVTAAGFLVDKAEKVEFKLTHTFMPVGGLFNRHNHRHSKNRGEFAGIMLDYEVDKNKFVRKALSVGVVTQQNPQPGRHPYGAAKPTSDVYVLGDWVNEYGAKHFTLDLAKLAPEEWTGKVYISAATGFIAPGRQLTLQLVKFNDAAKAAEVVPVSLAKFARQAGIRRQVSVPQISGKADFNKVIAHPLPGKFYKLGLSGYSNAVKTAAIAMDKEYVCGALEVAYPGNVHQVEFWLAGSNKKVWQFIAYSDNSSQSSCNLQPFNDKRVKISSTANTRFFFAIPRKLLGAGNDFFFNLACYRHGSSKVRLEFATYAALVKSFYDPANFAYAQTGEPEKSTAEAVKKSSLCQVYNLGKGGYTTGNIIRSRLPQALKLSGDVVILLAGTNDMLNTGKLATFEQYEKNLRHIVKTLQQNGSKVVMNTIPPCSEKLLLRRHKREKFGQYSPMQRIEKANEIVRKVAAELKCELCDLNKLVLASGHPDAASSLMRNMANVKIRDGVHLRAEGYRLWAKELSKLAALRNLPANSKIVCVGDSLTYGAGMKGAGTAAGETMCAYLYNILNKVK